MPERDPWALQRWAFSVETGNPVRKSVLMALAVIGDSETGRCEAKQTTIVGWTEASERTVRGHIAELVERGVIAKRAQHRYDGRRRGDEFLLLAPWVDAWPDGQPARSAGQAVGQDSPGEPAADAGQEQPPRNDHAHAGRNARASVDEVPDDFPDDLRPHARAVMRILLDVAQRHGAKAVHARSVGLVLMARPRKPMVRAAHDFAAHFDGGTRQLRDVVASYRNWLDREDDLARVERLPGEAASVTPGGNVTALRPNASEAERRRARQEERLRRAAGEDAPMFEPPLLDEGMRRGRPGASS